MRTPLLLLVSIALTPVHAQQPQSHTPPNSFPHEYPGIPNTNANFQDSQAWQNCTFCRVFSSSITQFHLDFLVKDQLPNMTFPLERSFAGNIPVNRQGHPNDTLFFWAFEKTNGSLTRGANDSSTELVSCSIHLFVFPSRHIILSLTNTVYKPVHG